jgi:hypothetical protein
MKRVASAFYNHISFSLFFISLLLFWFATSCLANASSPEQIKKNTSSPNQPGLTATPIYLPLIMTPSMERQGLITDLQILTPDVSRYEKFEFQFNVHANFSNPYMPFDPAPPAGLPPAIGITVDAIFSPDEWISSFIQPAFYTQPYIHTLKNNRDHFIPDGPPRWSVRFAPQIATRWEYRLRIIDSLGTAYYPPLDQPALSITVSNDTSNPYVQRGFLQVSKNDPRYFEFQDGTPFIGVGFNGGFKVSADVEQRMVSYEKYKINFLRIWLSSAGINGSQWTSWASHHLSYDGYIPGVSLDIMQTYQGNDVSLRLDQNNPCLYADFWQGGIPVQPLTTYQLRARVRLNQVTGPASPGDYGFAIKQAGWLDESCSQPGNGTLIVQPLTGTTEWIIVEGSYTTHENQYWLDNLYLALENTTDGIVYVDEVKLWKIDDPDQVNILRDPYANSHYYFDPMNSAKWDLFIQSAEMHGVYLKLVIDEKNEWIRNRILANGEMSTQPDNNNFYASQETKSRWLQVAWWRYLIARWGYSTAIHSFEYVNEGDPYNGNHHQAADAFANFIHENDPSHHMATTSFWAAFPNIEFWSNLEYSEIDYADLHAYISTGWGDKALFVEDKHVETNPMHSFSPPASARVDATEDFRDSITPRGVVIRGAGEWIVRYQMKAENFNVECPYNTSGGMQHIRWLVDGGRYWGGIEGIVPTNQDGKDFVCTSPSGTFDWTEFRSDLDRDGNLIPKEYRLFIFDDLPHEINLIIENSNGLGGTAWLDDVELIDPSGKIVSILGNFDPTHLDEDTAWYNLAYATLWGGGSSTGARKPLVRGETGIDYPDEQDWNRDLLLDTQGIWLHNNVWGQVNPGGMIDLFWWSSDTIPENLYIHYLTYRNFMEDIPLSNGYYQDAKALTSDPGLRAWGQRDDQHGRFHLWIQNIQHTWKRVVFGPEITPIDGTISLENVPLGQYRVTWWDTYAEKNPVILIETVSSNGQLTLNLPFPLSTDLAVHIEQLP